MNQVIPAMRSDMAKVIVERPRYGSRNKSTRKGYQKARQRCPLEDAPRRESIYALRGRTRILNEHLGPLRRYLVKQVGRPWRLVFAEICANIRLDSAVQSHVRDHIEDFVETKVQVIDGIPHAIQGYWTGRPLYAGQRWTLLYICPRTGLLRRLPQAPSTKNMKEAPLACVPIDSEREYRLADGIWYEVQLQRLATALVGEIDVCSRESSAALRLRRPPPTHIAVRRRQLNKRELRRLGLRNASCIAD